MDSGLEEITVLVVEDHGVTLQGLVAGLSKERGIKVVGSAATSDEGFELAKSLKPKVILLDLYLPGSHGPKTNVRLFSELPSSAVIVFSAEQRTPFVKAVLEAGATAYLLKSEQMSTIVQTIRAVAAGERFSPEELMSGSTKVTKSEQEILKMLARGMKYDEIAERRSSSPATVRKQCELLVEKLMLGTRERLIAWAAENGYGNLEMDS